MEFSIQHLNRAAMPEKHVLIVEDDLAAQLLIVDHFGKLFGHQGKVLVSIASGAIAALGLLSSTAQASAAAGGIAPDLILLDHDLPHGMGPQLLEWMRENRVEIPVLTFSGIDANNERLMAAGATHQTGKGEVYRGEADELIKQILGVSEAIPCPVWCPVCIRRPEVDDRRVSALEEACHRLQEQVKTATVALRNHRARDAVLTDETKLLREILAAVTQELHDLKMRDVPIETRIRT